MNIITFKGRKYKAKITERSILMLDALRRGVLNHVGPCKDIYFMGSTPQIYNTGICLVACAVSCNSQHIDTVWNLIPVE